MAAALLKRTIQSGKDGHCSEIDAIASMELAIRRIERGSSFRMQNRANEHKNIHLLNCLKQQQQAAPTECSPNTTRPQDPYVDVFVGPASWLTQHVATKGVNSGAHTLTCETLHDSNQKAITAWSGNPRARLIWGKFSIDETNTNDSFAIINSIIVSGQRSKIKVFQTSQLNLTHKNLTSGKIIHIFDDW